MVVKNVLFLLKYNFKYDFQVKIPAEDAFFLSPLSSWLPLKETGRRWANIVTAYGLAVTP